MPFSLSNFPHSNLIWMTFPTLLKVPKASKLCLKSQQFLKFSAFSIFHSPYSIGPKQIHFLSREIARQTHPLFHSFSPIWPSKGKPLPSLSCYIWPSQIGESIEGGCCWDNVKKRIINSEEEEKKEEFSASSFISSSHTIILPNGEPFSVLTLPSNPNFFFCLANFPAKRIEEWLVPHSPLFCTVVWGVSSQPAVCLCCQPMAQLLPQPTQSNPTHIHYSPPHIHRRTPSAPKIHRVHALVNPWEKAPPVIDFFSFKY